MQPGINYLVYQLITLEEMLDLEIDFLLFGKEQDIIISQHVTLQMEIPTILLTLTIQQILKDYGPTSTIHLEDLNPELLVSSSLMELKLQAEFNMT
jgi:hypothetical protein